MKNVKELRNSLVENYEQMTATEMPLATGKQLANTAGKILSSLKIEMEYNVILGIKKPIEFLEYDN